MNTLNKLRELSKTTTSGVSRNWQFGDVLGSLQDQPIAEDLELRKAISELEAGMQELPGAAVGTATEAITPLVHHFAPGVYGREMFLPAGTTVVGKLHKHSHLNILAAGAVRVATEDGVEELSAPCIWTSKAGTKRAVFALTDAVWVCVHPTKTTDLRDIERETIAESYTELGYEEA